MTPCAGFHIFLAAYTAVNRCNAFSLSIADFLAAYTAVNELTGGRLSMVIFLAAYTAVN